MNNKAVHTLKSQEWRGEQGRGRGSNFSGRLGSGKVQALSPTAEFRSGSELGHRSTCAFKPKQIPTTTLSLAIRQAACSVFKA